MVSLKSNNLQGKQLSGFLNSSQGNNFRVKIDIILEASLEKSFNKFVGQSALATVRRLAGQARPAQSSCRAKLKETVDSTNLLHLHL
jgi:hypothetical protein